MKIKLQTGEITFIQFRSIAETTFFVVHSYAFCGWVISLAILRSNCYFVDLLKQPNKQSFHGMPVGFVKSSHFHGTAIVNEPITSLSLVKIDSYVKALADKNGRLLFISLQLANVIVKSLREIKMKIGFYFLGFYKQHCTNNMII